uniref:Major sperm protein n=1 Tax=Strongyloides papillosus TaxID=174720 RepID=A0A0N5C5I6_STREA
MTSENRFDSESAKLIIESKIPDDALIELIKNKEIFSYIINLHNLSVSGFFRLHKVSSKNMTSENRFDSESANLIIEFKIPDNASIEFITLKRKLGEKTFACPWIRKMTFLKKKYG